MILGFISTNWYGVNLFLLPKPAAPAEPARGIAITGNHILGVLKNKQ